MSPASARTILLDGPTDSGGFRAAARRLLAGGVAPGGVEWFTGGAVADELFLPEPGAETPVLAEPAPAPRVPAWFGELCDQVSLHRDRARFELLYRLLWRLQREPGLRHDPLDADRVRAEHMAAAVRRDMHKMKAFVRFRPVPDPAAAADAGTEHTTAPLHVAWFEPEHHVVEATAPFFARRFAQMRWAILTPERCVRWDGQALCFGPGAARTQAPPADAGEQHWLTYYASIFNPARLKLAMMRKEMPRRYWNNQPEARLISPPAADAPRRSDALVERSASIPARRIPGPSARATVSLAAGPGRASPPDADPLEALARLKQATDRCRECPLGEHATQSVTGQGPPKARLMFVGEQPGDQEDLQGRPFVGPAGKVFSRALDEIGLPREQVYVSNAVKHFKYELRGKRRIHKTPTQQEIAACRHWLEDEIRLVQPEALVALGATAARSLMGRAVAVMSERGQWLLRPDGRRVFVTVHPSSLLRMDPEQQGAAYAAWVQELRAAAGLP